MKCVLSLLLIAALLVAGGAAQCTANVVASARPGSWQTSDGTGEVLDLIVENTGTCTLSSGITIFVNLPAGSSVISTWGLTSLGGGVYTMEFSNNIATGQSLGGYQGAWGLVVDITASLSANAFAVLYTYCPGCGTGSPPPPPAGTCSVNAQLVKRTAAGSSWQQNGQLAQIYDIILTDTGSLALTNVEIYIFTPANTYLDLSDTWNLVQLSGNLFLVQIYSSLNQAGATYNGAGFVLIGSSPFDPAVVVAQFNC